MSGNGASRKDRPFLEKVDHPGVASNQDPKNEDELILQNRNNSPKDLEHHTHNRSKKIIELFGNSMTFDFSQYHGKMDFIFIDANHSYAYVKSDTENALKMLSEHGVILWHDYDFIHPGVFKLINEVARDRKIYYIERTRYAIMISDEIYS